MSESRFMRKERPKYVVPPATRTGLTCPACHGRTVARDVSPDDGWYVEYCSGGTVKVYRRDREGRVVTPMELVEEPCEYWGVGRERRKC